MMNFNLSKKNALVCGSSKGIGKAIAIIFSKIGANVTLLARNKNDLLLTLSELKNNGTQNHSYIEFDLSSILKDGYFENHIKSGDNAYHILVNNVGGPAPGDMVSAKPDELLEAFTSHLIASQMLVQNVLSYMKKIKYGRIINILSVGLKQPINNLGVSNTIRGAMGSWAKTLSREVAAYGITVNNILPGYTKTERLKNLFDSKAHNENISIEEIEKNITLSIPANRLGNPEEPAYLASFLASEYASYITGTSIPVDGGLLECI